MPALPTIEHLQTISVNVIQWRAPKSLVGEVCTYS